MKLQIASINVQCPQNFMLQALYPPSTSLFCLPSSFSAKWGAKNVNLAISVRSRKFLRYQYLDKNFCKSHSSIQPSCNSCTSLFCLPSSFSAKWGAKNVNLVISVISRKFLRYHYLNKNSCKSHSTIQSCCSSRLCADFGEHSEGCSYKSKYGKKGSFLQSEFESLEPKMLGIRPEPPYWPEREAILCTSIEQKAKSFGLPLSLRMIKKKHQCLPIKQYSFCSVKKAFSSLVFIIVELQTYALHLRESVCNEDLEMIIGEVQREMYASFIWLFRQVFSRTPVLMIYVMIILANFSVYSTSHNIAIAMPKLEMAYDHVNTIETTSILGSFSIGNRDLSNSSTLFKHPHIPQELSRFEDRVLKSDEEIELWNSIEDEALNIRGLRDVGLDHEVMLRFFSPLSVEIDQDNNVEYFKTDLLYQMALSHEPYNTLLLCNYAQFLQVTARDYNRAEECFKRAVQVEPPDAEVLSQYANFLWTVRKNLWEAEERYQQAVAAEPRNPYYASTYANFLWSTGGEETCFLQ
ncbi:uncharacterized protein [Nicotiana tomentosiformis]|uniref:uncharacterized protein n=1 Tax=Nicotiana tomentosiformis TaxID=4098 RepID=UPI00051B68A6|nr:uncharacterized protein LOC104085113 isoform X1 [Nicotiana tomentosiformis]